MPGRCHAFDSLRAFNRAFRRGLARRSVRHFRVSKGARLIADPTSVDDSNTYVRNYDQLREKYLTGSSRVEKCPVCDSRTMIRILPHVVPLLWSRIYLKNGDNLQLCDSCGTIMMDRIYKPDYYREFLDEFYKVVPDSLDSLVMKKGEIRNRLAMEVAQDFGVGFRRILEVSSYDGSTLDLFQRSFEADVFGVEPTTEAVAFAERTFPKLVGRMCCSLFEESGPFVTRKAPFDLILLSYCFRQMSQPSAALDLLAEIIAPGGFVLLDEGELLEDIFLITKTQLAVRSFYSQKCFFYSHNSLIFLFERHGFEYVRSIQLDKWHKDISLRYRALIFKRNPDVKPDQMRLRNANLVGQAVHGYVQEVVSSEDALRSGLLEFASSINDLPEGAR